MNLLYLDFDGVLHHENCLWHPRRGAFLCAPERYTLFQNAPLLEQMLEPYPAIKIVLSTSWVLRYGCRATAKRLPPALAVRVIGATFHSRHMPADDFRNLPRGQQVAEDVMRRRPSYWVALDDNDEGWTPPYKQNWIQTHKYEGLNKPGVLKKLNAKLEEMHE